MSLTYPSALKRRPSHYATPKPAATPSAPDVPPCSVKGCPDPKGGRRTCVTTGRPVRCDLRKLGIGMEGLACQLCYQRLYDRIVRSKRLKRARPRRATGVKPPTSAEIAARSEAILVSLFGPRQFSLLRAHAPEGYAHEERRPTWEALSNAEACRRILATISGTERYDLLSPYADPLKGAAASHEDGEQEDAA